MLVSRLLSVSALLPIVGLGCALVPNQAAHSTTDDLATYDTHATYDAKLEQYGRDYGEWLTQRRATYRRWRETVEAPARSIVTESQWRDFQATVETKCAKGGDSDSSSISECRSLILGEFLSKLSDGYQSLNRYEARHGVGPPPTYPKYNLAPSPPTDHEIEYEQAKKDCAEKNGEWVSLIHYHGWDWYAYSYRCWKEVVFRRGPKLALDDPVWNPLVSYDIYVRFDRRSNKLLKFEKYPPSNWDKFRLEGWGQRI